MPTAELEGATAQRNTKENVGAVAERRPRRLHNREIERSGETLTIGEAAKAQPPMGLAAAAEEEATEAAAKDEAAAAGGAAPHLAARPRPAQVAAGESV